MRLNTYISGAVSGAGPSSPKVAGFPVLCLHGHPGSGAAMAVFTTALAASTVAPFTLYAPDLRGYGRSRISAGFEMTAHLDDIEELLAQYQIEQCLVLGWSLGGILAMELALRRPDVVRGLILVATAARPRGSHPPIRWQDNVVTGIAGGLNWLLPANPLSIALGKRSLFRYLIGEHTPQAYRYLARQGAPALVQTSRYAEAALTRAIRAGYNRLPELRALSIPSLMLCAECDRHITADASLETARTLPNCQAHCYPNTAHLFPWEISERVNADIHSWLTAHAALWV